MKIHRKIFMGVISILLLLATFSTSTYAWFKINSSASVEGFDFQVHGGEGFQVSIDGVHYYRDLSLDQIKNAIVLGYNSDRYEIIDEKLCSIDSGLEVSEETINTILNENILLLPLTSTNGIQLTDLYNSPSSARGGRYMQFSIYFKTTSNLADDARNYDIYLQGQEMTLEDGTVVQPTSITSDVTKVSLAANMVSSKGNHFAGEVIDVKSANALRMSIEDTSLEAPEATIYELSDSDNLGSYATDYNGNDEALNQLYNADINAMYTYYNNLRPYAQISKMNFENRPNTIRDLGSENLPKITTVQSGADAKLVTFRFWLEGWDADCFDGLDKSINVKLSFTSKQI